MGLFTTIGTVMGGASVLSSLLGAKASKRAAGAVQKGQEAQYALGLQQLKAQRQMFKKGIELTRPYRNIGTYSLRELRERTMVGPGEFKESPGYQFTLGEGLKQIQRMASAQHRGLGGRTLKDLTAYATGLASTEYDKFLNRYYQSLQPFTTLAGIGQAGVGQALGIGQTTLGLGVQTAGMMGQAAVGGGQAQAAGVMGQQRAFGQPLQLAGQIAGAYGGYKLAGPLGGMIGGTLGGGGTI